MRHTNASLPTAQGVDVRTVANLLGHAQVSTTLDIYAHAFDKNKRKTQEKLEKAIGLWEKWSWPVQTKVSYWKRLLIITIRKRCLDIAHRSWKDWCYCVSDVPAQCLAPYLASSRTFDNRAQTSTARMWHCQTTHCTTFLWYGFSSNLYTLYPIVSR